MACWCLHPVICIGTNIDGTILNSKVEIEQFDTIALTDYDAKVQNKGGWFETLEALRRTKRCFSVEKRSWNTPSTNTRTYKLLNGSGGVNNNFVMILDQSQIYTQTDGANGQQILGFNQSIVDTPNSGAGTLSTIFQSTETPELTSSMAMFVKLNNFGQNVVNAHNGNPSKIIAHLPRFDNTQSTGRLYFEPNNLIWLDLDNPSEMQINEFDLSFCYVNEQYATILTGQSIVALYFRKKPKELM